jgi:hypothetical protein
MQITTRRGIDPNLALRPKANLSPSKLIWIYFTEYAYSGKILIATLMNRQTTTLKFFDLPLVIAALTCLCLSHNVGPQFLPLPRLSDHLAESELESQRNAASALPPESANFRVPMMVGQRYKHTATELQPQPLAASALRNAFEHPVDVRKAIDCISSILFFTSASSSQPPGRAPPRLV